MSTLKDTAFAANPGRSLRRVLTLDAYFFVAVFALVVWFHLYAVATVPEALSTANFSTWIFLTAIGFGFWGLVLLVAIPYILQGLAAAMNGKRRRQQLALGLAMAIGLLALPLYEIQKVPWQQGKPFDDVMAVSNAHVLVIEGFDEESMFFRSFLRVGFVAATLPVAYNAPVLSPIVTKSPSDKNRRLWQIFLDKPSAAPGVVFKDSYKTKHAAEGGGAAYEAVGIYPRSAVAAYLLCLLLPAAAFRIFQCLGLPALSALFGGFITLHWFLNSLQVPLTQTFTFTVGTLMAMVHFCNRGREYKWSDALTCGFAIGLGGLTMSTLIIVATAIAIDQLVLWIRSGRSPKLLIQYAVQWLIAGVIVLIWYDGFLRGFPYEMRLFRQEIQETHAEMKYTPISVHEIVRTGTQVFDTWGIVLLPIVVIFGCFLFWKKPAFPAMLGWLVVAFASLAAMPFVFPRFLMYAVLPAAWFVVSVMSFLWGSWQSRYKTITTTRNVGRQVGQP